MSGGRHPRIGVPWTGDADAAAWIAAIEAADGAALPATVKTAYQDFVAGCKTDGNFSAFASACMLRGARTLSGCLVPLVGPTLTYVDDAFVSGDYSPTGGLTGARETVAQKALNTNYSSASLSTSSFHLSVDTITHPSFSGAEIGFHNYPGSFPRCEIGRWEGGFVNEFGTAATSTYDPYTFAGGPITGFKCVNRSSSSSATVRQGSTDYTDSRTSSGSFSTGDIWVFARHNIPNPMGAFESAGPTLGWYSLGTALASPASLQTRLADFAAVVASATY